ncbi:unnamed protein product [Cochlearia groenlandica]
MDKAMNDLDLVDLTKHNFRQTLDSLKESANSLLLLSIHWNEIEGYFDSSRAFLRDRAKELESLDESIKAKALELDAKEKELNDSKKSEFEIFTKRIESMERFTDDKLKELDERAKGVEVKVKEAKQRREEEVSFEFEPLCSLLAKNLGSSVTMPTRCSTYCFNEKRTDFVDDLVKKNLALARVVPYLDPGKLVLDAIEGSIKEYLNKDIGEEGDRIVNSCIVLLEKLIDMSVEITPKTRQGATQLGITWINKAKTKRTNRSLVLGCLLFVSAYGLASVTTREVLLTLFEGVLWCDHAPKLFRLLGLEDEVYGAVETLKEKEEYIAMIRFICEFRLQKLSVGDLLLEYLDSQVNDGTGDLREAQARREKIKADAVMALECIRKKKAESMFPAKTLERLVLLTEDESAQRATQSVDKSCEKGQITTDALTKSEADSTIPYERKGEAKRQRLTEPVTPFQNSTVDQPSCVSLSSEEKIEESGVNNQVDAEGTYSLSTVTNPNVLFGSINADMLRKLLEKQPLEESDLSNAIKCLRDPAKLVLDTSMVLCPTNPGESYEFKLLITSDSCLLLLDSLKKLSPQIEHPVKEDAKKLAVCWKDKISKSKVDVLEVVCFLQFLGIFGIVSEFKANDLLSLLDNSYWRTVSPDLCQFLGLVDAVPGFIQNLIKTGHRLKAVDYIYSFDMVHRFQPVSAIINDSLRITKEYAEKSSRDAKNESAQQVAAIDKQVRSIRAAIRCIKCHKLESEFQLGDLEEQIKSLLKLRRNPSKGSGYKPDMTTEQSPKENVPSIAEVGSVTSNTPLEPSTTVAASSSSASKPRKKNKGKKRGMSYVHGASHPSNRYPERGYTPNQRQTSHAALNQSQAYPVDGYRGSYTAMSNSDYRYNQWTEPERERIYQSYQHHHHSPYYMDHF